MRVLLDECVPRKLKRELPRHEVVTVTENGWSGFRNGGLLELAEGEFDVFLTVDPARMVIARRAEVSARYSVEIYLYFVGGSRVLASILYGVLRSLKCDHSRQFVD